MAMRVTQALLFLKEAWMGWSPEEGCELLPLGWSREWKLTHTCLHLRESQHVTRGQTPGQETSGFSSCPLTRWDTNSVNSTSSLPHSSLSSVHCLPLPEVRTSWCLLSTTPMSSSAALLSLVFSLPITRVVSLKHISEHLCLSSKSLVSLRFLQRLLQTRPPP